MRIRKLLVLIYIFNLSANIFAQESNEGRVESFQGLIGVYNDQMKGESTASGEAYNPDMLTAAHTDLPFGTQLRVTNFANGRTVIVKVNDRGTKNKGRVLEVSRKAAQTLDFLREGVAYVKIDVLPGKLPIEEKNAPPAVEARMTDDEMSAKVNNDPAEKTPQDPDNFYRDSVQDKPNPKKKQDFDNAQDDVELDTKAVNKVNPDTVIVQPTNKKLSVNRIFVIQFGAFSTVNKAENFQQQLGAKGIKTYYAKEGKSGSELYKVREITIYRDLQEVFSKVIDYKQQGIDCFAVGKFFVDDK